MSQLFIRFLIQSVTLSYVVGSQLFDYKALAICMYNSANKCDNYLWYSAYSCCYYGNESIT